jgi:5-methylcytosine-specific restriction endonuclease McrA
MMRLSTWRNRTLAVYERDGWQCRMPECTCPNGRALDPALVGQDGKWVPSVDHIMPRALGGKDDLENLRAAHWQCNQRAAEVLRQKPAQPRLRLKRKPRRLTADDMYPGDQGSRWS